MVAEIKRNVAEKCEGNETWNFCYHRLLLHTAHYGFPVCDSDVIVNNDCPGLIFFHIVTARSCLYVWKWWLDYVAIHFIYPFIQTIQSHMELHDDRRTGMSWRYIHDHVHTKMLDIYCNSLWWVKIYGKNYYWND